MANPMLGHNLTAAPAPTNRGSVPLHLTTPAQHRPIVDLWFEWQTRAAWAAHAPKDGLGHYIPFTMAPGAIQTEWLTACRAHGRQPPAITSLFAGALLGGALGAWDGPFIFIGLVAAGYPLMVWRMRRRVAAWRRAALAAGESPMDPTPTDQLKETPQ